MKNQKIALKFAAVFSICCFLGVLLLRFYAMIFFYRTPEKFLPEIGGTLIATVALVAIFLCIMIPMLRKFDATIEKLRKGENVSLKERQDAMKVYSNVVLCIVIGNLLGFVIGQVAVMTSDFLAGRLPYIFSRSVVIVIQAISIGAACAFYEAYLLNFYMLEPRRLLKIENLDEFGKQNRKPITVTRKIILAVLVSLLLMGVNMLSAPYYLLLDSGLTEAEKLVKYLQYGLISFILSMLSCVGLVFVSTRELKQRINDTSTLIKNLGQHGDLSERISLDMNDDMGVLASSMNFFMDKFSDTIQDLYKETDNVSKAATALEETVINAGKANEAMISSAKKIEVENDTQSDLITEAQSSAIKMAENASNVKAQVGLQSKAVQKSSSFVNNMAENVKDVANMAKTADELANNLKKVSATGGDSLNQAIKAIDDLQNASNEVASIVKVIQKISSQTNLLAMNAAIESAHAGEAGKGFAVVAEEVRNLSLSTAKSANDIRTHIEDIIEKVNVSVNSINGAEKAFKSINDSISQTSELMQTINSSMEKQRNGATETLTATNEVVEAITVIEMLADKQTQYTDQVQKNIQSIVESSENVIAALNENRTNSTNMTEAISIVSKTSQENNQAVDAMEKSMSGFHIK